MRRKRDDDSFANSTQCDVSSQIDASSQADYSQADLSQADISQTETESKADSMRTRPARKRRRTVPEGFATAIQAQPFRNVQVEAASGIIKSLAAGRPVSVDEQSLTSDSADEQLQMEMANADDRAVMLDVACENGKQITRPAQPGKLGGFAKPPVAAVAAVQAVPPPPFMNGHFGGGFAASIRDDSAIDTSYNRSLSARNLFFTSTRPRSNSLPNEFDDDNNAMDTS